MMLFASPWGSGSWIQVSVIDACLYHTVMTTSARSRNLAADSHYQCINPNLLALLTRNYPGTSSRPALIPLHGAVLYSYPSLSSTAPPHAITLGWTYLKEKLHFKMSSWLQREPWTHCTTAAALPCKSYKGNEKTPPNILLRKKTHYFFFIHPLIFTHEVQTTKYFGTTMHPKCIKLL